MNRILRKRFPREIKNNFFRYFALFFMIVLCMYLITSMVDAAEVIIRGTDNNQIESKLEDGQITVFSKFTDSELEEMADKGVTIEPHFSFEVTLEDNSVLRVFKNREKVDLVTLDQGRPAESDNEIVLEKRYCEEHEITLATSLISNVGETNSLLKKQEEEEIKFALGISENTHDLAIAAAKANTALSYTVALRDKFLEAYKELMQIQV